jgi:hypothetical protein
LQYCEELFTRKLLYEEEGVVEFPQQSYRLSED